MKIESTTLPGRHDHPPQPVSSARPAVARPARRVGLLDRAALHLGLALITWGRRPVRVGDREHAALAHETHQARLEAERVRTQNEAFYLTRIL
ncbi:hypothetical protein [Conyzicola sp.]|uniref:hypothetical protein n=1 Tax=Conyzicola sp. TaxID=1969404 RepID=UPI0039899B0F